MLIFFFFLLFLVITLFVNSAVYPTPLSDMGTVRYRSIPWMTWVIILINSLVFILFQAVDLYQGYQNASDGNLRLGIPQLYNYVASIQTYGYRSIFLRESIGIGAFATFTSMFMHAELWHWLGNMIYLWTFGRRLEDACGPWRYLLFYLLAGMVANIGSDILNPSRLDIPGIGASGAISGVMGAYLVLFPGAMVVCFWGIGIVARLPIVAVMKLAGMERVQSAPTWRWTIRLPAWMLLISFLVMNAIPSLQVIQSAAVMEGVNTLAHFTGFLAAIVIFLFIRKDVLSRYVAGRAL
jgi:membrane associated rhomboid family serine protease